MKKHGAWLGLSLLTVQEGWAGATVWPRAVADRTMAQGLANGTYTTQGYGLAIYSRILDDGNFNLRVFEETNISCINVFSDILSDNFYAEEEENGTIKILTDNVAAVYADKVDNFVGECSNGITFVRGDPDYNQDNLFVFDVVVASFAEHYAFFDERGVDWAEMTASVRSFLGPAPSDEELFQAIVSILEPLDDGHVYLEVVTEFGETAAFYSPKPFEIESRLEQDFLEQDAYDDPEEFMNAFFVQWIVTISSYMQAGLDGSDDSLFWGKFSGTNIGYILMLAFSIDDQAQLRHDLERAMVALHGSDTIIFDIRVNSGGRDEIALLVASYFAVERTNVFSKKAWDPRAANKFAPETQVFVEPVEGSGLLYSGKVILMTSGSTVSAAEIFALSMAQFPHVTLFGRPTGGEFSDVLPRRLPNGWRIGLSNEVYTAPDGVIYEIVGIPPTIFATTELLPLEEIIGNEDSWLMEALALAAEGASSLDTQAPTASAMATPTDVPSLRSTSATQMPSAEPDETSSSTGTSVAFLFLASLLGMVYASLGLGPNW